MEFKNTLIGIIVVALLFVLVSCDTQSGKQYQMINRDDRRTTTIEVTWVPEDRISNKCISLGAQDGREYRGCARSKPGDESVCEIYAVRPRDFDDRETLYHFGHEAWHCLGAKHN